MQTVALERSDDTVLKFCHMVATVEVQWFSYRIVLHVHIRCLLHGYQYFLGVNYFGVVVSYLVFGRLLSGFGNKET